ncbi:MAG: hypothetical protein DRJ57_01945 [Thermoprotei archaeon]|nr:MAG: hypothetical protein DRJ57_01945 [Thermoprotei archaeon]
MRGEAVVIAAVWVAIAAIAIAYIYIAGVNIWSSLMLIFLLGIAFTTTITVYREAPSSYTEGLKVEDVLKGIGELRKEVEGLKALMREIKKILEE